MAQQSLTPRQADSSYRGQEMVEPCRTMQNHFFDGKRLNMLVTKAKVQYVFDCFCTVPIETDHRICVGWIWVVQGVMPQKPLGQQEHGATDPRG